MQAPLDRYHRQMLLPGIGADGQRRLADSGVVIAGCGALGCAAADLLVRAGVGRVTVIDRDTVEETNLQRQTLFTQRDADEGRPKAVAAADRLCAVNPLVRVEAVVADLTADNAVRLINGGPHGTPRAIIDGTDNFETRFLLNDLAVKLGVPYLYGGVISTRGVTLPVVPAMFEHGWPCLRCVIPEPPEPGSQPTCDTAGVFGPAVAIVAASQVSEAIKLLVGAAEKVRPSLLEFDLWDLERRRIDHADARRADCPCCVGRRFEFLDAAGGTLISLCGRNAVQVPAPKAGVAPLPVLHARLASTGEFRLTDYLVSGAVRHAGFELELTVFADGRAVVKGTDRADIARSVYARFVGT